MSSPTSQSQESSVYDNLQIHSRQIRLLKVISTNPEIVCRLKVVSLDDEPAYSALSYVWGDPAITKSILVNGKRVHVTTNLASALEHAPKHLEDANVAPRLWADAICINQDDPNEKNHQVPFMKNIYSQAEIVICWLGPPDDQIHRGFDWIDIIVRECSFEDDDDRLQDTLDNLSRQKYSQKKDLGSTQSLEKSQDADMSVNEATTADSSGGSDALASYQKSLQGHDERQSLISKRTNLAWVIKYPSFYEEIGDGAAGAAGAKDLISPFDAPYWTRVWIFQEVALAKKPIFACGARSISLASLDRFACWTEWLTDDPTITKPQVMLSWQWEVLKSDSRWIKRVLKSRLEARRTAGHPISSCLKARDAYIQRESHWYMAYNLVTSNPKDYFYGFLSLSCLELVPDYSDNTSVGMVCRDFMVEYVRACRRGSLGTSIGELELLVFAGVGHGWHEYPETPSWAPNLPGLKRSEAGGWPVIFSNLRKVDDLFPPSCEKAKFVGSDMPGTVLILDTVQDLGPVRRDFGDPRARHKLQGILSWILNFAMSRQEYVTGCHPLVALHSMLHFDSTIQERERFFLIPGFNKAKGFVQWVASNYKEEAYDGKAEVDQQKPSSKTEYLDQLLGGQPIDEDAVNEETTRLIQSCFERAQRLAETSFGYVGIFPLHVQPGDVVCR
ncbi:hypothetical protein BHE90_007050 [Fusarium euwallaceae]|uniref:Heterokaryon incompatibility domain-containing protein n=1 Tax=Fusarium euwallaceae TaxID=1147111 RepID=A0A430LRU1_9HYPO|nr:hypothetical protein BHE90_007050 [Fusarium euwallaceae]